MSIDRQRIDCNCNDCGFFVRSAEALNASKSLHRRWSAASARTRRADLWSEAQKSMKKYVDKGDERYLRSYKDLLRQRSSVSLDKSYRAGLVFGCCSKLNKDVQTVPNVCQIDTQDCFVHRKDL